MQQMTKRWLSLLLAAVLCVTAGGVPALAAELAEGNTAAADSQTGGEESSEPETGGGEAEDNDITTLPTLGEDRPVISDDAPTEGGDTGDTGDNGTGAAPENPETPENPENPSDNGGQPADDDSGKTPDGSFEDAGIKPAAPAPAPVSTALPEDFFTSVEFGKGYDETTGVLTPFGEGETISADTPITMEFHYEIPAGVSLTKDFAYEFEVEAPLAFKVDFDITGEDGKTVVAHGTTSKGTDGKTGFTLTFLDEAYCKEGSEGYFYVGATFEQSEIGIGGKKNIAIKADGKLITTIHPDFAQAEVKAEVKVEKTGKLDAENHKVDWTVTVTPNVWAEPESEEANKLLDHIHSLVVTDDLVGNHLVDLGENPAFTLDEASLKAVTKSGENAGTFAYTDGRLTFTGSEEALKKTSWPIKLTFTTTFDPDNADFLNSPNKKDDTITFSNEAKAKITAPSFKADENGQIVLDESEEGALKPEEVTANASVSITYASLKKSGKLTTGKTVHWSITAKNSLNQKNPRIVDTLPKLMELVEDGSLKWIDGTALVKGTDYNYDRKTNVLTIVLKKNTTEEQTVEYDTRFRDESTLTDAEKADLAKLTEVKNNAKLVLGGSDDGTGGTTAKEVTEPVHIGQALMRKRGVQYNPATHTTDWEIVIEPIDGKELHNVILTDVFDQTCGQYYVQGSMKMTLDGTEAKPDVIFNPEDKDDSHKTGFTLTIEDTHHTKRIVITYQTKMADAKKGEDGKDDKDGGQRFWGSNSGFYIWNTLTMSANGLPAKAEIKVWYRGTSTMLTKKVGSYDPKTHEISWTMTVNQNNMPVHNGKIVDTLNKDMPGSEDWEFVQDSVQFSDVSVKKAITFSDTKPQTMTISLKDFDKQITITYKTRLTDEGLKKLLGNGTQLTVKNSAQLTGKEVADTVKAEVSKTIGWDVLRKTVSFDGGNTATWCVDVNRNHAVITAPEGTHSIGISDTLQKGLVYLSDSLKVYQVDFDEGGNASNKHALTEGTEYKVDYDETNRTLSITWLNMSKMTKSYQVEFQTQVLVSGTYNNTVQFFGVANGTYDSEAGSKTWRLFSGGSAKLPSGSGMLRIIKTDGTTKKALDGVTFALKYADTGKTFITDTTDSEGKLEVGPLPAGKWIVEEVATKDGYKIPTVPVWTVDITSQNCTELPVENFSEKNVAVLTPQVTKAVSGAGAPTADFTFTLKADTAGAPMPAANNAAVTVNKGTDKAVAYFGQIQYTSAGDYEYTIQEQPGSADHFTYDTKAYKLYVHVERDSTTNQLTATAAYGESKAESLTITNKYQRYVKYAPAVTKRVKQTGPIAAPANEEFAFTLTGDSGYTDTVKAKTGAAAQFREIEFTGPGTYEFTITETEGTTPYMSYDKTAHKLVVTVTENTDGTLAASAKYNGADSLTVTNEYHEFVACTPEVTKKIDGANVPKDKTFTFELKADPETADAPLPERDKQTASVKDEGMAKFGAIEFSKAGTYKYILTEKNGGERGFTYDTAEHKLTVTVTKNAAGLLEAAAKYDGADSLTITNKYRKPSSGGGGTVTPNPKPTPDPDKPTPDPDKPTPDPDKPTPDPDKPTPDPVQPSNPDKPSQPDKPTPPHYPIDKVPDPNDPDAPDPIIIDDEKIPTSEFHIKENPDGTFEYVDEDDVPLSEWIERIEDEDVPNGPAQPEQPSRGPRTGTPLSIPLMLLIALVCAAGAAALTLFEKKKFR